MADLMGIIAILCTIGLPITVALVLGFQRNKNQNKERMALINQGIIPPDTPRRKATPNRLVSLRNGIVLIALGIGLIVGFLVSDFFVVDTEKKFWVSGASVVFFLGVGYLSYFLIVQKRPYLEQDNEETQD